jgi:hypothetical protein
MTDFERGYLQGYADAMNWKTQNHLEHLPGRQELVIDCPRCGHCCPQPNQEPVAWMYVNPDGECEQIEYEVPPNDSSVTPLYAAPRPWVGLTMADMAELRRAGLHSISDKAFETIANFLKDKNT